MALVKKKIGVIAESLTAMVKRMQEEGISPNTEKSFNKRFSKRQAAEICGVPRPRIDAFLKENPGFGASGKANGAALSLEEVTAIKDRLNPSPVGPAAVVSIQNSKGGVAKTTTAVNLAQILAQQGKRVLLLDGDPQGSSTAMFGVIPDVQVSEIQTILPFVKGIEPSLDYAIMSTYHPNIDLIQGCLTNTISEQLLVQGFLKPGKPEETYKVIHRGLTPIKDEYDVIIFDTPPSHSMLAANYIYAADLLVVPTPPSSFDIIATAQFFTMVDRLCEKTGRNEPYIKLLKTKYEGSKGNSKRIAAMLHEHAPESVYDEPFAQLALVQSALEKYSTPFEMTPEFRNEQNIRIPRKAMDSLTECFDQIVADINLLQIELAEAARSEGVPTDTSERVYQ